MVAVKEFSWEEVSAPHFGTPAREAWRQAVATIADKAKAKLPECNGRVDSAVKIVLAGDVEWQADGTARVASQSNGTTKYFVVNGECTCPDFVKAPSNWCKHRIAAGIYKRATARIRAQGGADGNGKGSRTVEEPVEAADVTPEASAPGKATSGLPEATLAIPEGLAPFIVHLHGKPFVQYAGLLTLAHARGLVHLKAHFISVTAELALAEAEATFADGKTYGESADATPGNVGAKVTMHFPRLALTRAKARVLRDALNINLVSVEELEEV